MLVSSAVTPIGILIIMLFARDLMAIYGIIFVIGLTYNSRGSGSYIYASEFMPKKY